MKYFRIIASKNINQQFDQVIPLHVVAGLREVVVHVQSVHVAFFGANVQPFALEW
jgi:hypothetical protein